MNEVRLDNTELMCATTVRAVTHIVRDNLKIATANACSLEKKMPGLANARLAAQNEIEDLLRYGSLD